MLTNKIVFITGASSGIGAACAKKFAEEGAKLLLGARRLNKLQELAETLQQEYDADVHIVKLDVCRQQEVQQVLSQLPKAWQEIDILVNNAGLALGLESFSEGTIEDWERMIDTNIKGLLYVTRAVLPGMVKRDAGHIINIGSIAGHYVYPNGAVYCATKHAVKALTEGIRMDVFGTKVRVSTVDPGAVKTNFSVVRFKGDKARAAAVYQGMTPLCGDDVADAVWYCASRPAHVNISEVIIMPTDQYSATLLARRKESQN
ncbi:SDR family oxidoreductase [Legionella septentrionalis]|uniref:SDR family oxidoreductase n=1 Tax=Legionella septentrionalis TaxID=2498109 RepID=A0A433JIA1_9GAMM|nr:SDR family oxidoreductase [Legionella septentrionalis]RUQ85005.1 SDR family oxidoreductase [Legionella septentrionalis]